METIKLLKLVLEKLENNDRRINALQESNATLLNSVEKLITDNAKLNEKIDVYRIRDIEQKERIEKLEKCQKFEDVKDIAMEMIRVRNIVYKKLVKAEQENEKTLLQTILKHLDVSLSRAKVCAFFSKRGDTFDPSKQTAMSTVPVDGDKLYGKICSSDEPGYYLEYFTNEKTIQRIISYEKVTVYLNKGE